MICAGIRFVVSLTIQVAVHAWDYRRYILVSGFPNRDPEAELRYTTRKIEGNFSNFSAWHQRTKVLGRLWREMRERDSPDTDSDIENMRQAGENDLCKPFLEASSS